MFKRHMNEHPLLLVVQTMTKSHNLFSDASSATVDPAGDDARKPMQVFQDMQA